jgi:UDP-galactopyranose mutase
MKILIVGAGLYGSVCAYELGQAGYECCVIDKRDHIGGNIYTKYSEEADCHEHIYGAHIFHTNSEKIWKYINQFSDFNHYTNRVKVKYENNIFSFPVNLFTLFQIYGVQNPDEAKECLAKDLIANENPQNMEEFCLSIIGKKIYNIFIEGYTQKQWGRHPKQLPSDIIKRIPFRLNFDDNYFNDKYQGIPIGGYTSIVEKMLCNASVELNTDFFAKDSAYLNTFDHIIYSGPVDEYFNYKFGILEYRSLKFQREVINTNDFQGCAVVNYTHKDVPWTRIIEHKHFDMNLSKNKTVIYKEYPDEWFPGKTPFYPINDHKNKLIFQKYQNEMNSLSNVSFGGRLGDYQYYDMHQVIGAALHFTSEFLNKQRS